MKVNRRWPASRVCAETKANAISASEQVMDFIFEACGKKDNKTQSQLPINKTRPLAVNLKNGFRRDLWARPAMELCSFAMRYEERVSHPFRVAFDRGSSSYHGTEDNRLVDNGFSWTAVGRSGVCCEPGWWVDGSGYADLSRSVPPTRITPTAMARRNISPAASKAR